MATLEDIVAASKILSEEPDPVIEGSDSKPQENQGGPSKVRNGDDVSAVDTVSERNMEIDTIVAASEVLPEEAEPVIGGSDSKSEENQDGASEVRNGDGNGVSAADAVVSEPNIEIETAVAASETLLEDPEPAIGASGSKPQETQDGSSEVCNGDGVSATDAVVSEPNIEIETVVAASEILSENPETIIGASGSKPQEIQNGASEVCNGSGVSTADADTVVSEPNIEIETVVAASEILSEDPKPVFGASESKPQEIQDGTSEVCNGGGVSAADTVVSERDMEIETVVSASVIHSEDPKPVFGASDSKPQENHDVASELRNGNEVSDADPVVSEQNMEIDTVVVDDSKEDVDDSKEDSDGSKEDADDSIEELVGGENSGFLEESNGEGDESADYMDLDGEEGTNNKLKDNENVFHVGDFVWAKIRSHPWWPGQVYDPKDASEFAMKRKQEGRLLVAFFGDGTCSWCSPSQLIPFVENFSEMSTDSSSKSFLNAVEKALDEVGRLVESEMTCKCIPEDKRDVLVRPVVENAGLKTGVVVPEIDADRLSLPSFETNEVLEEVVQLARTVNIDSGLNLAIMKSLLSAFYNYKGGYQLSVYHVPVHIEGLEDKDKIKNVDEAGNDFSVPIEVPILGPQDDDWLSSPAAGSVENKGSHKRKQKSVAELMGENKNMKPKNRKKEGADSEKSLSSQKKKTKNDEEVGSGGASSTGSRKRGLVKEGVDSEKSLSSQKKTTKNDEVGSRKKGLVKEGADSEKPLSSEKKKKKETKNDGEVGSGGESSTGKKGRKRKVEEMVVSPNVKEDSNAESRRLLRKPKEIEVAVDENVSDEAKEEMEMETVTSPRERKKSKYLSPPYTNVAWRTGISSPRSEAQAEHDKTTKITQVGDLQKEEGKLSNGKLEDKNADKKLSFPVSDVDAPVNELLSDIELASRDPFYLTKKGSLEKVCAFASALRSSINFHGEDYEIYAQGKAVGEQEPVLSQLVNDRSSHKKAKSSKRKKKADEASVGGSTIDTAEGTTTSPCLILQFTAGFPLPSKKDIVQLFDKFGSLNKKATKVDKDSHSICVAYVKDSDAEAAFESSLKQSPFPTESGVNYMMQRSSPVAKKQRSGLNVSSPPKQASSGPTDELVSDFYTIKQKLEITTAIVENYHGKFSGEDRSSLKDEMKRLMEEVETVSEKVRVMAEKSA